MQAYTAVLGLNAMMSANRRGLGVSVPKAGWFNRWGDNVQNQRNTIQETQAMIPARLP